jgi:NADH-quinone oxidoreductase subunit I
MANERGYFGQIAETTSSVIEGLLLTLKHLFASRNSRKQQFVQAIDYFNHDTQEGIVTLQYPKFKLPVPAIGRYELDCIIEDCIVCDKCAKICPVNCIDIVAIKSPESIGETSDGTTKRIHAAKFDIDMAKCCFCGLCTTVCPTECLTMTNEYDHSTFTVGEMNFSFATMSVAEIALAQTTLEADKLAKEAAKQAKEAANAAKKDEVAPEETTTAATPKPKFSAFKKKEVEALPTLESELPKPELEAKANEAQTLPSIEEAPKPKAAFKPFKKKEAEPETATKSELAQPEIEVKASAIETLPVSEETPKPKAAFKPFKKKEIDTASQTENPNPEN